MKLLILRAEPGASATLFAAKARGIAAASHPIFKAEPLAWTPVEPEPFDAILGGSANAFRHGGEGLARLRDLPVYAVGEKTAEAAIKAGFAIAEVGSGGLQKLLDRLGPKPLSFLRLAGEERVDLTVPPHISLTDRVIYRMQRLPVSAELKRALGEQALSEQVIGKSPLVALHSAAAARAFCDICEELAAPRDAISLIALGPRIAYAAGQGWKNLHISDAPNDTALLSLAAALCEERA